MKFFALAALVAFLPCSVSSAQAPVTGNYAFASFDNRGFDSVNLGNLNTRFTIPIFQKTGRGLGFSYALQFEGLIWTAATGGSSQVWVPSSNWGFSGVLNGTGFTGYLSSEISENACGADGDPGERQGSGSGTQFEEFGYVYHDGFGASHPFGWEYISGCSDGSSDATTLGGTGTDDDSGYTLITNGTQIQTKNGVIISPAFEPNGNGTESEVDLNGNQITFDGTSNFTDTTGATAVSITGSNPVTFTYPVAQQTNNAATASASLSYKPYSVRTNFGCSGIVEYGTTTVNLVDHLTLADGSTYSFTYEGTPGATDGAVTARLASITLPSGGTIGYTYSGGCSSTGAGINADGTVGSLTRITSDGTRTYTRGAVNANATATTLQDEKQNQTVLQFTIADGYFFETHRQVYQGTSGGSLLLDRFTCYNGATASCDGQAVTLPVTEADYTTSYNNGTQDLLKNAYDGFGNLTSSAEYSGGVLLEETTSNYGLSYVTSTTNKDGSGNIISSLSYGYDETTLTPTSGIPQHIAGYVSPYNGGGTPTGAHFNPTSVRASNGIGPFTTLSTTTYYDTGVPVSTTAIGGVTTYSYDPSQTFVTQSTLPTPSSGISMSTSATYDTNSGVLLTSTGVNSGQTTTVNVYDNLLRPTTVTQPNNGQTTASFSPTGSSVSQNLGSQNANVETLLDAYGRTSRSAVNNGQTQNPWYQSDTCYDQTGLVQFVSASYQSTGFNVPIRCSGSGTSYQYDALGRVTSVTNDDGTSTTQYSNRAVKKTDVNGVQKITQYDLLGRVSSVCEISSNSLGDQTPTSCGADIAGTGYLTTYTYDLENHKVTVAQGPQQRIFQTDALGRPISTTEPERGTTTYSYAYNSVGLQITRARPRANQSNTSVVTHTTTQYDTLGRVVSISYDDGLTASKNYYYDAAPSGLQWNSSPTNTKGLLVSTVTGSGSSLTESQRSYDIMSNVTNLLQCAPSICGGSNQSTRPLGFSYDLVGNLLSEVDPTSGNISYTRTPAGEISSITNNSYSTTNFGSTNLVSNVINTPFGPTSYALGNGVNSVKTYDSLGRTSGGWACLGSSAPYCSGGSSQLWGQTVQYSGKRVIEVCDTALNECAGNGYDEFNRLSAVNDQTSAPGDVGSFSYTYDRWGNRLSEASSASGTQATFSIQDATNQITEMPYDAAGNLENDGLHTYTYDAEGNILQVDNGNTATYVYDALGNRVSSQTSAGSYEYLFDIAGRQTSTWLTSVNFGVEGRMYSDSEEIAYRGYGAQTFFQHKNYLGTTRARTNYQGTLAATEQSGPFGENFNQNVLLPGGDQDTDHYAGQDHDAESGTEHAVFRQYVSTQGRWMSPDPYDGSYHFGNPQTLNRYAYALNNPIAFTDPSGLQGCSITSITLPYDPTTGSWGGTVEPEDPTTCEAFGGTWDYSDGDGTECELYCLHATATSCASCAVSITQYGGSFGDSQPASTTPTYGAAGGGGSAPNNPCANATLAATGVNARANIAQANSYVAGGASVGSYFGNPYLGALVSYGALVNTGGLQDVKNQPGPGTPQQRIDAGNINFGLTCPFGAYFCQLAAGLAQTFGKDHNPGPPSTFFDSPGDNASIKVGIAMRKAGC